MIYQSSQAINQLVSSSHTRDYCKHNLTVDIIYYIKEHFSFQFKQRIKFSSHTESIYIKQTGKVDKKVQIDVHKNQELL